MQEIRYDALTARLKRCERSVCSGKLSQFLQFLDFPTVSPLRFLLQAVLYGSLHSQQWSLQTKIFQIAVNCINRIMSHEDRQLFRKSLVDFIEGSFLLFGADGQAGIGKGVGIEG